MQGLIQDLLQFSRVTTKPRPFTTVDLNRVAAEVLDDLSIEIEESGAVVSLGDLPSITADPLQMRQLILNLSPTRSSSGARACRRRSRSAER